MSERVFERANQGYGASPRSGEAVIGAPLVTHGKVDAQMVHQ
jgi:hypothetical protein